MHIFNENSCIRVLVKISLKLVPKGLVNNKPKLAQMMAWRQISNKPLSETMLIQIHDICITQPR